MRARPCLLLLLATLRSAPLGADARVERSPSTLVYPDFWHTPLGIHRGTPALLALLLDKDARFDDPSGLACTHLDSMGAPSPQISAFGLNSGSGQIVYNPDMKTLASYGSTGSETGQFLLPQGIAAGPDGRVVVADTGNNRLALLQMRGKALEWERVLGEGGGGPGQFHEPSGVALDSQGRIYVADTGNNRVQVFGPDGSYVRDFGGNPDANNCMTRPVAIAVVDPQEPYASAADGSVYVVDQGRGRIQRFSLEGRFLGQLTAADLGRASVHFDGLALDYFDNVWATDREACQILKFDQHLQWVDSWGKPGDEDGCLDSPRGIAIVRHYGQVLVLEKESAQYLWVGSDIRDVKFSPLLDPDRGLLARLDYRVTERAWVDAWVEGPGGKKLATLADRKLQRQGDQTLFWNGDMDDGKRIPAGPYTLVFQAEATYASATYVKRELRKAFVVK
jgi:DNA-binding beta-propeller fold protein YncE